MVRKSLPLKGKPKENSAIPYIYGSGGWTLKKEYMRMIKTEMHFIRVVVGYRMTDPKYN
jgi:hypothetical protein